MNVDLVFSFYILSISKKNKVKKRAVNVGAYPQKSHTLFESRPSFLGRNST